MKKPLVGLLFLMVSITGGKYRGLKLHTVPGMNARPTTSIVRKAIFDMVDVEGKDFLDLFCGGCVVSLEAISRGAKKVVAVDISTKSTEVCKRNSRKIKESFEIVRSDARKYLKRCKAQFDVVFMDPPYDMDIIPEVLDLILKGNILREDGVIIVEKRKGKEISLPEPLFVYKEKRYGDTEVLILKRKEGEAGTSPYGGCGRD